MTDDTATGPTDANEHENAKKAPQQASPAAAPSASPDIPARESSAPLPASAEVLRERTIQSDMARLLKEVKLPERHEYKASAEPPAKPPETKDTKQGEEPVARILEERIVKAAQPAPQPVPAQKPETPAQPPVQPPVLAKMPEAPSALQTPPAEPPPVAASPARAAADSASSIVMPLRTLKDDLQSIVRDKKISLVRAVSLEEEKKRGQEHLIPPEELKMRAQRSRHTFGIIFTSLVLVLLGIGALFGVLYVMQKQQAPQAQTTDTSILFAEQTEALPLDKETSQDLKNEFISFTAKPPGPLGSITRIVPTLTSTTSGTASIRPATLAEFFNALDIHPPQELMSALGSDFFFGVHVVDKNAPIFVIPVTSYDRAFAGMLAWEATMDGDLAPIFPAVPMTKYVGTSTVPVARTFEDVVLRNYDTRALEDDSGTIELYYSFPTPNILVIAESPYSFSEILNRLEAQREL